MNSYFFKTALLPTGWQQHVRVTVEQGIYQSVEANTQPQKQDQVMACVIPQMPNVHSHVFQRAMAGMSEYRTVTAGALSEDDFWSWRDLMYSLANDMDTEQLYQVAKSCYQEMKQAGYLSVCEFHYLHRAKDNHDDYVSHAKVILQAAEEVGLDITLLPVLYAFAGVGDVPLSPQQKRFELSVDEYLAYHEAVKPLLKNRQTLGICFHSLRAVNQQQMQRVIAELADDVPIHIHIAEQQAEVDAIEQHHGKRPVEWLFENFEVNHRWCLVHATHLNESEVKMMAESSAVAGICPLTEANLGDGVFPMPAYMQHQGLLAIGSDSHIEINPANELKMLEYSQRLQSQKRNVCCDQRNPHVGTWLWLQSVKGGAQVSGQPQAGMAPGQRAAIIALNQEAEKSAEVALDSWVFSDFSAVQVIDL